MWHVFETRLGHCGFAWQGDRVTRFCLPDADPRAVRRRLADFTGEKRPSPRLPPFARKLVRQTLLHLEGEPQDFSATPVDFGAVPGFHRDVYAAAIRVPAGEIRSYGELAELAGRPGAARAVGQAMGRNPIPLVIPCHRITAAGGRLGGFTASGGVETKLKLLEAEGVRIRTGNELPSGAKLAKLARALGQTDPLIGKLIRRLEPPSFSPRRKTSPYEALFSAIVHQQLHASAAQAILKRIQALAWGATPAPEKFLRIPDEDLRAAGLSRGKLAALRDLAQKTLAGVVPSRQEMARMTDAAIIRRLVSIHGVGQWTVEMLLIFTLARPDVLPVNDYAVKVAFARLHGLKKPPTPKEMARLGAKWAPYRSLASLYLWKSLDS